MSVSIYVHRTSSCESEWLCEQKVFNGNLSYANQPSTCYHLSPNEEEGQKTTVAAAADEDDEHDDENQHVQILANKKSDIFSSKGNFTLYEKSMRFWQIFNHPPVENHKYDSSIIHVPSTNSAE